MRRGRVLPTRGDFIVLELVSLGDSRIYAAKVKNSGMPAVTNADFYEVGTCG